MTPISIIIRASGELTIEAVYNQWNILKKKEDDLILIDNKSSFEKKLRQSFTDAIKLNKKFALLIDADILFVPGIRKHIDTCIKKLSDNDLGFGLKLFDKFYGNAKYRGIHIYRVSFLKELIDFIPPDNEQLRPESFLKKEAEKLGYYWNNNISNKIVGLHDYYQSPQDIYYKFFVRSKRSMDDIKMLKSRFLFYNNSDYKIALSGLQDGQEFDFQGNNKEYIIQKFYNSNTRLKPHKNISPLRVKFKLAFEVYCNLGIKRIVDIL